MAIMCDNKRLMTSVDIMLVEKVASNIKVAWWRHGGVIYYSAAQCGREANRDNGVTVNLVSSYKNVGVMMVKYRDVGAAS